MASGNRNLTPERGRNIWTERSWRDASGSIRAQQWLLGTAGLGLVVYGLRERSASGGLVALAGGALLAAACSPYGLSACRDWLERRRFRQADDPVEEASAESFPASDSPSWTSSTGTGVRD